MDIANDTENARTLLVLYASQTGTACEVAERIGRDARRRYFSVKVMPMDEYDIVSDPTDFEMFYIPVQFILHFCVYPIIKIHTANDLIIVLHCNCVIVIRCDLQCVRS